MPIAARLFEQSPPVSRAPASFWSGELRGEVGAMHRALEQRLLSGKYTMAVVPLPVRPVEELIARASRAAGWMALAGVATGVVGLALALLG